MKSEPTKPPSTSILRSEGSDPRNVPKSNQENIPLPEKSQENNPTPSTGNFQTFLQSLPKGVHPKKVTITFPEIQPKNQKSDKPKNPTP